MFSILIYDNINYRQPAVTKMKKGFTMPQITLFVL